MIKAIETHYAGCRFRSRLEARWAVVLDHLGIRWEYEAQGFSCHHRVSLRDCDPGRGLTSFPYLPDFWLPDEKCYLEVKGSLTPEEMLDVMDRAASLCDRTDTRLILAGPIPAPGAEFAPTAMSMRKGCLLVSPGLIGGTTDDGAWLGGDTTCIAHDTGGTIYEVTGQACDGHRFSCSPFRDPLPWKPGFGRFDHAYAAARSARFEFGESG